MFGIKRLIAQIEYMRADLCALHNVVDRAIAEQASTQRVVTNFFTMIRTPTKIDYETGYASVKGTNQTREEMQNQKDPTDAYGEVL